jgi:protein phosphatase
VLAAHRFGATDIGRYRKSQEDVVLIDERLGLYVVADGMGGRGAGDVAATLAGESVRESVAGSRGDAVLDRLKAALVRANRVVFEAGETDPNRMGMATTLVAALVSDRELGVARVGDSRAYRLRGGSLDVLVPPDDASQRRQEEWEKARKAAGRIGCILPPPQQALGVRVHLEPALHAYDLVAKDVVLLCSDGLSGMVEDSRIREILVSESELETAGAALIQAANDAGGKDNVGIVLVRFG